MRTEVTVRVDDVIAKLQPLAKQHKVERLTELSAIVPDFEIEATIDAEAAASEAGYVKAESLHKDILYGLEPNSSDLREGLRALIDGDRNMAAILLGRAFEEWDDARLIVEEVLLSRTIHDHRQPMLLVA